MNCLVCNLNICEQKIDNFFYRHYSCKGCSILVIDINNKVYDFNSTDCYFQYSSLKECYMYGTFNQKNIFINSKPLEINDFIKLYKNLIFI